MKRDNLQDNESEIKEEQQPKSTTRSYFYISLCCCVMGAVAFGLCFTALGIYSLISSVLLEITALAFLNTQQKKNNFKAVFYLKVIIYAALTAFVAFFIGGIIYGSTQSA